MLRLSLYPFNLHTRKHAKLLSRVCNLVPLLDSIYIKREERWTVKFQKVVLEDICKRIQSKTAKKVYRINPFYVTLYFQSNAKKFCDTLPCYPSQFNLIGTIHGFQISTQLRFQFIQILQNIKNFVSLETFSHFVVFIAN